MLGDFIGLTLIYISFKRLGSVRCVWCFLFFYFKKLVLLLKKDALNCLKSDRLFQYELPIHQRIS